MTRKFFCSWPCCWCCETEPYPKQPKVDVKVPAGTKWQAVQPTAKAPAAVAKDKLKIEDQEKKKLHKVSRSSSTSSSSSSSSSEGGNDGVQTPNAAPIDPLIMAGMMSGLSDNFELDPSHRPIEVDPCPPHPHPEPILVDNTPIEADQSPHPHPEPILVDNTPCPTSTDDHPCELAPSTSDNYNYSYEPAATTNDNNYCSTTVDTGGSSSWGGDYGGTTDYGGGGGWDSGGGSCGGGE